MSYASLAQIASAAGGETALVQVSDEGRTGARDLVVIAGAQEAADSLIDSYAGKRYRVPFAAPSLAIQTLSARMTVRELRRGKRQPTAQDVIDEENDRKWLEQLSKGLVSPGADPYPESTSIATDTTGPRDSTKNVSRESTKGLW